MSLLASPTAKNFTFLISAFLVHSTSFSSVLEHKLTSVMNSDTDFLSWGVDEIFRPDNDLRFRLGVIDIETRCRE